MKSSEITRAVPFRKSTGARDDRYFMLSNISAELSSWIKHTLKNKNIIYNRVEDPCAGSGEMTCHFPGAAAFDLNPEPNQHGIDVKQRDFMAHNQEHEPDLLMLMNVPYGTNSNMAVKFFNHAAQFADILSIVVPKTWGKQNNGITRRLNNSFVLLAQKDIPPNSFYLPDNNNKVWDVPSVAQIWVRQQNNQRKILTRVTSSQYFVIAQNKGRALLSTPDIAIRRTGASAGTIATTGWKKLTTGGWLFITITKDKNRVLKAIQSIDWSRYGNGMGQRGINIAEVITAVEQWLTQRRHG